MNENTNRSGLVRWSLIVGIVIVMNLFFNYAISLVYKAPDYNVYFPPTQVVTDIANQKDCVSVGGQWNGQTTMPQGYCDQNYTRQQAFRAAQKEYNKSVFIILVLLGVASIITGALLENEVLSLAFSWGGVLSLVIASMRYWSDANDILRVGILAIALASLIWITIKKFA